MIKINSKFLITSALSLLLLGCSNYKEAKKTVSNEIRQANECLNQNKEFENDCYDLISYKNSIALLRLGIREYALGNHEEALKKYSLAQVRGNFYANALLSEMYLKGRGVEQNQKKGLSLLKDVSSVDPIAAYKLSYYYMSKKDYKKSVELLEFAANNNVKEAQQQLSKIYKDGKLVKMDIEKSELLDEKSKDNSNNFINMIYGI